jgi:hypothetical protein
MQDLTPHDSTKQQGGYSYRKADTPRTAVG